MELLPKMNGKINTHKKKIILNSLLKLNVSDHVEVIWIWFQTTDLDVGCEWD